MITPNMPISSEVDESQAIGTLVHAFAADPAVRWMYPDEEQYLTHFPRFVRAFAGRAFEHGTATATEETMAVALWLPPEVSLDEEALGDLLHQSVSEATRSEVFSLMEQMGKYHPVSAHWYLPLIGVHPRMQNRGLGSALLLPTLARCDREGIPAYLESSNPRNLPLYRRLGFHALGRIQTQTSPPIIPMLRPAR